MNITSEQIADASNLVLTLIEADARKKGLTLGEERETFERVLYYLGEAWAYNLMTEEHLNQALQKLDDQIAKAAKPMGDGVLE